MGKHKTLNNDVVHLQETEDIKTSSLDNILREDVFCYGVFYSKGFDISNLKENLKTALLPHCSKR